MSGNPPSVAISHQVKSGDTLSRIAQQHHVTLQELLAANPQVQNPDRIRVGQLINIPAQSGAGPQGTEQSVPIQATEPINVVIDTSHHNGNPNFEKAAAAGIVGVIQKATQGVGFKDPTYETNRQKALDAGLLFGAYHFGTGADGSDQADFFLDFAAPDTDTLLVLDFEPNPRGSSMTLEEAREFVSQVSDFTGRFPGLYSGHFIKEKLGNASDPDLAQCFFWLAQYGRTPIVPRNWTDYTLWQYTDGAFGPEPHDVDGFGRCDRNKFNGDLAGLKKLWGVAG